jgi:hypothetical protein
MMGNVSAKQLGMLHTIYMYVCMYVWLFTLTCTTLIMDRNTHTTLGNILDWDLRLGLGGGDSGPRVRSNLVQDLSLGFPGPRMYSNLVQDLNVGFQVLGCSVASFKISI